jgi:hypothetical protein
MSLVKGAEPCAVMNHAEANSLQALDHPPIPRVGHQSSATGRTAALCDLSALIFFPAHTHISFAPYPQGMQHTHAGAHTHTRTRTL